MTIYKNLVPADKYSLKCPHPMTPVGICVHNTANDASAKNEIAYMVGNTSQTSFHFAVDDKEMWQGLPLDRNGWHAGDGANGEGNRKYIGIEICYSKSGGDRFTAAEVNAAKLIAELLKERNWGIERVKKHQDFSGKYCPHRTLELGWDRFLNLIQSNMEASMDPELSMLLNYYKVKTATELILMVNKELGFLADERKKTGQLTKDLESAREDLNQEKKAHAKTKAALTSSTTELDTVDDFLTKLEQKLQIISKVDEKRAVRMEIVMAALTDECHKCELIKERLEQLKNAENEHKNTGSDTPTTTTQISNDESLVLRLINEIKKVWEKVWSIN